MKPIILGVLLGLAAAPTVAHADDVFEACKGESKHVVTGTGKLSIAIVLPDDFPGRTERAVLFPIGERLAAAEKANVILVKEVDDALKLVGAKQWTEKSNACGGAAPSLVAVLGLKHPNLSTAHTTIVCEGAACKLRVDLERFGRPTAERWVRYEAPLAGDKGDKKVIAAAAPKLKAIGAPPDAPTDGLAVKELLDGKVYVRADVDGSLEVDKLVEANAAVAACSIKGRRAHDARGFWAEWEINAQGGMYSAMVKPFAGRDPKDAEAAKCLEQALNKMQVPCPREQKVLKVKAAICL